MKKLIVAASCALALAAGTVQAKDWKEIRIAFDVPYEPFEYKDENGELTGFEVELAEAMCDEMNADCEFVIQSWDGMIPGLLARKFDLIMSSMSITPERAERVLFSEPYYNTPGGWFGPESLQHRRHRHGRHEGQSSWRSAWHHHGHLRYREHGRHRNHQALHHCRRHGSGP